MVQRYEFEIYHCNGGEVVASDDGEYVSYEDYAALEEKLKSLAHAIVNAGFDPVGSPDFELAESIVNDN